MAERLVLIPVHNEASHVRAIHEELRRHYEGPVLYVEDGSDDPSLEIIQSLRDPAVSVLSHRSNLGYGASLIEGFQFALEHRTDSLVTMDCDWQHEPSYVPRFFEELEGWDVISGSRYLPNSPGESIAPEDRQKINAAITRRLNELTGYRLTDSFCGFKAYRVNALRTLKLTEKGYGFPVQFLLQAWKKRLRLREIPVPRLYLDFNRAFGGSLDNPEIRLRYYESLIEQERKEWNVASWS